MEDKQTPEYYPGSYYQPLFDFLQDQFDVLALDSEMADIIKIVNKMQALHPESAGVNGAEKVKAQLEYLQGYIAGLADRAEDDFERSVMHQRIGTLHNALLIIDLYKEGLNESPAAAGSGKEEAYDDLYRLAYSVLAKLRARTQYEDRMLSFRNQIRKLIEETTKEMQSMPQPDNGNEPPYIVQSGE